MSPWQLGIETNVSLSQGSSQVGRTNFGVISIKMVFEAIILDETTERVCVDREENLGLSSDQKARAMRKGNQGSQESQASPCPGVEEGAGQEQVKHLNPCQTC